MKKKQEILFVPVFMDGEGKHTLLPTRTETVDGKLTEVVNEPFTSKSGIPMNYAVNRKSRRYREKLQRQK